MSIIAEPTDVIVNSELARGLVCPFTKRPLVVHLRVLPGVTLFCAPDAFSLYEPCEITTLYLRASMRDGVAGSVLGDDRLIDPYTGKRMEIKPAGPGLYYFSGGFNPRAGVTTLAAFVAAASMRNGVSSRPVTEPPKAVEPVKAPEIPKAHVPDDTADEDADRLAHEMAAACAGSLGLRAKKSSVTVSGNKDRHK